MSGGNREGHRPPEVAHRKRPVRPLAALAGREEAHKHAHRLAEDCLQGRSVRLTQLAAPLCRCGSPLLVLLPALARRSRRLRARVPHALLQRIVHWGGQGGDGVGGRST